MLITILDAASVQQKIIAKGQESVTDRSGSIAVTDTSQEAASANANRSGFLLQNLGSNPMYVNIGAAANGMDGSSFEVVSKEFFPPENFPITTGSINIVGTAGDKFQLKEW